MRKVRAGFYSPMAQKLIDAVLAAASFLFASQLAFNFDVPPRTVVQTWLLLPVFVGGRIALNHLLRCYRMVWKYIGLREAIVLAGDYAAFSGIVVLLHYISPAQLFRLPLEVIVTECLLSIGLALSVRVARRLQYERSVASAHGHERPRRVLLLGAGRIGVATANQLRSQPSMRAIAFIDDDNKKVGQIIGGLKVIGNLSSLGGWIEKCRINQVLVCISNPPRAVLRSVWATCELYGIGVKMVPSLEDLLARSNGALHFKSIDMKDLLGREPIAHANHNGDAELCYRQKRILITGAGGSIGSELAVQLAKLQPSELVLLDKDENGLHDLYVHLEPAVRQRTSAVVADLRFAERVRGVFARFRPEIVFHAAAHKHVHLMETNPCEAITNNVSGTRNLVEQSASTSVERFVQVSTDKAVKPTSIMGASKRVCEMVVQAHSGSSPTLFCCVRFGNVLGSRGSVVPIFEEQIRNGGPVTLTHPDARRFLMTIPEAVSLLIRAGTLANNRDIFVLDMGEPVSIHKLAHDMIELSGLAPERDVRIEVVGLKPGEKLAEALIDEESELRSTALEKIQAITTRDFDRRAFAQAVRVLERCAWEDDPESVYHQLARLNIGYVYQARPRTWPVAVQLPASMPKAVGALAPELSWNSSD